MNQTLLKSIIVPLVSLHNVSDEDGCFHELAKSALFELFITNDVTVALDNAISTNWYSLSPYETDFQTCQCQDIRCTTCQQYLHWDSLAYDLVSILLNEGEYYMKTYMTLDELHLIQVGRLSADVNVAGRGVLCVGLWEMPR